MQQLSKHLQPIYDLELSLGNVVLRAEEGMWSNCPLAIVFRDRLHFDEIAKGMKLPEGEVRWENRDTHYALEAGYRCKETRHSIAGPL
jgi:hypothetical protein